MRKPSVAPPIFARRRQELLRQLQGSVLIVASHPEHIRNDDVEHPYRQDSNLYYLTGFEEPESILVLCPGKKPETVMFVRRRDPERETWNGFRYGPEGTEKEFGIERCYPIDEFAAVAPTLLSGADRLYFALGKNPGADEKVMGALKHVRDVLGRRSGCGLLPILDADELLSEMRVIKSEEELVFLREACEISAQAHLAAMKYTRPGVSERQVQGVLAYQFLNRGAAREGYNYIVASGHAATTLHYNFNDQICRDGDLLLIDAGAEFNFYSGDITRTFPVNGRFTDEQALVYEGVLKVQKQILDAVQPGLPFQELHDMGSSLLTDLMLELGLLSGRKEDIIAANQHRRFYPHGIGHWLGLDVHDAGLYVRNKQPRALEPNMCFTVEPGLYLPAGDESIPKKFRGIGVRIEDNVRVTTSGSENLTSSAPKEIADLEKIVGTGWTPA